jgi:hypothetical protein
VSLTSPWLVAVLAIVAVVAIGGVVWLWPRLARTTWATLLGRVGLLAVVNVCVLLLVLATVNDQFQFFSDWADLVGAASTQATAVSAGGTASGAVNGALPPPAAVPPSTATQLSGGGSEITYAVTGGSSGVTGQVLVLLPPGYGDAAHRRTRYPVLEGIGGYPSTVGQLPQGFTVASTLAQLVAAHRIRPTIAVFVQPWNPPGRDTECVNGPGGVSAGDQIETWAAVDVPAWLRATFRTDTVRSSWATWGISAGAWCASMFAMLHPQTFSSAIALGGYYRPEWGNWHPFAPGDPRLARYDLTTLAATAPPPVALWLYASKPDNLAYPSAVALMKAAKPPLAISAHIGAAGGHRYTWWTPWFPVALTWLGVHVPGFGPLR